LAAKHGGAFCSDCSAPVERKAPAYRAAKRCPPCTKTHVNAYYTAYRNAQIDESRERSRLHGRTLLSRYKEARRSATRGNRNYTFDLTFEQYADIVQDAGCHYCGGNLPEAGGGLDRKDNAAGYAPDNVVACCSQCNVEKRTLSEADFLAVIRCRVDRGVYGE
jgi:hypothetical protein